MPSTRTIEDTRSARSSSSVTQNYLHKVSHGVAQHTVHFNDSSGATCDLSQEGWVAQQQQIAWTVRTATGSKAPVEVTVGDNVAIPVIRPVRAQEEYLAPKQ